MLGAIIGDVVGSRFEFDNIFTQQFEMFHSECDFTDDTICTIAVADSILCGKDYGKSIAQWCSKYPHPMGGYGARFAGWVRSKDHNPYNSFGNGSAMRVSAIGFYYDDYEEVKRQAKMSAECSHNHEEGIKGAVAVASAIWFARHISGAKRSAVNSIAEKYYPGCLTADYKKGVFDETCQGTVPLCFKIISESDSFEEAIRKAVAHGGDTDTIAAIVGGIAEAVWGIPLWMRLEVKKYLPPEMLVIIDQFYFAIDE